MDIFDFRRKKLGISAETNMENAEFHIEILEFLMDKTGFRAWISRGKLGFPKDFPGPGLGLGLAWAQAWLGGCD